MSGSAICQGQITATFAWQSSGPGDDPPDNVIVADTSTATYAVASSATAQSCLDGLGDAPSGPNPNSQTSTGTRYKVIPTPGTNFSINCTPSVNVAGSGYPNYGYATVSVAYNAIAYPLRLVLSGGIPTAGGRKYLIGQQCTATIQASPFTPSNIQWTVTGGQPFSDWAGTSSQSVFDALDLTTEHSASLSFHYKIAGTSTISCTCDLALPNGVVIASGVPFTAHATIENPTFKFTWSLGSVGFNPPPPATPTAVGFYGIQDPIYGNVGIDWVGSVTIPPQYLAIPSQSGFQGSWILVQIVTPSRVLGSQNHTSKFSMNGLPCLDTFFPTYPQNQARTGFPTDGKDKQAGDPPSQGLVANPDTLDNVSIADNFETWMMYAPPGDSSNYVPLHKMTWFWTATVNRMLPNGAWQFYSGDDGASDAGDYPAFPIWTRNVVNGTFPPLQ